RAATLSPTNVRTKRGAGRSRDAGRSTTFGLAQYGQFWARSRSNRSSAPHRPQVNELVSGRSATAIANRAYRRPGTPAAKKWTRCGITCDDHFCGAGSKQATHAMRYMSTESSMIAVIGNVIAGLG